jgi:hypothetical protein
MEKYSVLASKFLGKNETGSYTYELTFNQSLGHTGRMIGIENGLNQYVEDEIKEHEAAILKEAEEIKSRTL